jgi:hypothetical protein
VSGRLRTGKHSPSRRTENASPALFPAKSAVSFSVFSVPFSPSPEVVGKIPFRYGENHTSIVTDLRTCEKHQAQKNIIMVGGMNKKQVLRSKT